MKIAKFLADHVHISHNDVKDTLCHMCLMALMGMYTAKLLIHQSHTKHSDYTVTLLTTTGSMVTELPMAVVLSPSCGQVIAVTTPSLSSRHVVTASGR